MTLAAAFSGRLACEVVATVSAFPGSSSATPLRPVWSIYGSTRTPNDQLSAKITDHAIRATWWSGKETHRMDRRTITDGLQEAMIGAGV